MCKSENEGVSDVDALIESGSLPLVLLIKTLLINVNPLQCGTLVGSEDALGSKKPNSTDEIPLFPTLSLLEFTRFDIFVEEANNEESTSVICTF